jgi:hypothetical protein
MYLLEQKGGKSEKVQIVKKLCDTKVFHLAVFSVYCFAFPKCRQASKIEKREREREKE